MLDNFLSKRSNIILLAIVAVFMELSSLVITVEVFMASVSVRRYRKKLSKEGAKIAG